MDKKTSNEKVIKKIKIPTRISIGDKVGEGRTSREDGLFLRNFRRRDEWVGEAILKNIDIVTDEGTQKAYYLTLMYAPDEKLLNLFKGNNVYTHHKIDETEVVTETKKPILSINGESIAFQVEKEGLFADILEINSMANSLEGFIVTIYVGSDIDEKEFINNVLTIL